MTYHTYAPELGYVQGKQLSNQVDDHTFCGLDSLQQEDLS
jgi:hypothetical protein